MIRVDHRSALSAGGGASEGGGSYAVIRATGKRHTREATVQQREIETAAGIML